MSHDIEAKQPIAGLVFPSLVSVLSDVVPRPIVDIEFDLLLCRKSHPARPHPAVDGLDLQAERKVLLRDLLLCVLTLYPRLEGGEVFAASASDAGAGSLDRLTVKLVVAQATPFAPLTVGERRPANGLEDQ